MYHSWIYCVSYAPWQICQVELQVTCDSNLQSYATSQAGSGCCLACIVCRQFSSSVLVMRYVSNTSYCGATTGFAGRNTACESIMCRHSVGDFRLVYLFQYNWQAGILFAALRQDRSPLLGLDFGLLLPAPYDLSKFQLLSRVS